MTRFADPHRCPDCGAAIVAGLPACRACGLPLQGVLAQRLYTTLVAADTLLGELRATLDPMAPATPATPEAVPGAVAPTAVAPATATPAAVGASGTASHTPQPASVAGSRPNGLRATSVSKILLGLGATCVLVAALVFLAVTWSVMGVAGRTTTLVVLTLVCGLLAGWLARRDLRGGAEALTLVALGLLTLDTVGARDAGWLGSPSDATFLVLLGVLLIGGGGAAALASRRTPVRVLVAAELVAGVGTAAAAIGVATLPGVERSPGAVLGVLVSATVVLAALRTRLVWIRWAAASVTVLAWLWLLGVAVSRAGANADLSGLWLDLDVWPMLAAAALVGAVALARSLPLVLRLAAANVAYAVLTLAVVLPALDEGDTPIAWVAVAVLAAAAAVGWLAPRPWRPTALIAQLVATGTAVVLALELVGVAAWRLGDIATSAWDGTTTGRLGPLGRAADLPEPWQLPVLTLAVIASLATLLRLARSVVDVPAELRPDGPPATLVGSVLAASVIGAAALYPVPVWTLCAAAAAVAAAIVLRWTHSRSLLDLVLSAVFATASVTVAGFDDTLTGLALVVVLALALTVHLRSAQVETSAVAGAVLTGALAASAWTWAHVAGAQASWASLTALLVLAVVVVPVHLLPARLWSHQDLSAARAGLEVGAAVAALPVALAGVVLEASGSVDLTWAAVYLTLSGAAVSAVSLLRPDRSALLPVGGLLLAAASWVRLWELGVRQPEAYTLPTAALLAVAGLVHLYRRPTSSTATALSPALGLALVPSLLWALTEEPGLRALLLGLACLGLVIAGGQAQWSAPLVWGAVPGALLVLRLASPYVQEEVPTWVLIGAAGALLIAMGVTWEQRVQEARRFVGYARALR